MPRRIFRLSSREVVGVVVMSYKGARKALSMEEGVEGGMVGSWVRGEW